MAPRFVIIGGGPAGHEAAATAARLGAEVTLIERDVLGGAAHLWDCVPSKAMIATGGAMAITRRAHAMGLASLDAHLDFQALAERNAAIEARLAGGIRTLLEAQGVTLVNGTGRLAGPRTVIASTDDGERRFHADAILLSTGSRARIPDWAHVDSERVLTTRDAYPPPVLPEHLCIIGSGVTGVEFVHMFRSFGSKVTLVVSRQQVLPKKDPEVAAVLEDDFLDRGVTLLKGAKAQSIDRSADGVVVHCTDGRKVEASHALLAIGSIPNTDTLNLEAAGVEDDRGGYVPINQLCQTNVPHIYAAGDISGRLPLASVATTQGRRVAEHVCGVLPDDAPTLDYDKAASAIFTEPEIADVGLPEAEAFASGRKVRVTKVPFSTTAKALIDGDPRGFVKLVSDPYTGVVLGGSIVGRSAAELISVIALAVSNHLRVVDLANAMLVHPALVEALTDAAE